MAKQAISLRLPGWLIENARLLADKKGVAYNDVYTNALVDYLNKEAAKIGLKLKTPSQKEGS